MSGGGTTTPSYGLGEKYASVEASGDIEGGMRTEFSSYQPGWRSY